MFRKKDRELLELIERQTRGVSAFVTAIASELSDKGILDGDTVARNLNELMKELDVRR